MFAHLEIEPRDRLFDLRGAIAFNIVQLQRHFEVVGLCRGNQRRFDWFDDRLWGNADKEGFLRSQSSLIQTIGRAARNASGKAILYADRITDSMQYAIDETNGRRALQEVYNREHGITPKTIIKPIEATLVTAAEADYFKVPLELDDIEGYSPAQIEETIARLDFEMREHAKKFEFEKAAELRDRIKYLRERELVVA